MGIRVQPDEGPPVEFLQGGSRLVVDEDPAELVRAAIARLRLSNRQSPARPKSLAITHCEEALLWITALSRGEVR